MGFGDGVDLESYLPRIGIITRIDAEEALIPYF
jgi:hypothetical protein